MFSFVIIPSPLSIPHCVSSTSLQWPLIKFLYVEMWKEEEKAIG